MFPTNASVSCLAESTEDELRSADLVLGEAASSDAQLIRRVARGEGEALGVLYDRFSGPLYSFATHILNDPSEAEDVVQEVFLKIWEKAPLFDAASGRPFNWAVTITRRKSIDCLRTRQRRHHLFEADLDQVVVAARVQTCPSSENVRCDQARHLRATMEELPEDQRRPIELAFFCGLTHPEIARELKQPLGTIKARIRRGLVRLRDGLEGVMRSLPQ